MQQKNVKLCYNIKPKIAVCPKTAAMSQIRINREWFFGPNLPKNGFSERNFENLTVNLKSAFQDTMCANFHGKPTM